MKSSVISSLIFEILLFSSKYPASIELLKVNNNAGWVVQKDMKFALCLTERKVFLRYWHSIKYEFWAIFKQLFLSNISI